MNHDTALVNGKYLLEKFAGKGGWTYVAIPEIAQNKNNPFGWVTVKGSIDSHLLSRYKLMPMGEGRLFLPVKAEVRKKIKKEAGDYVHITLYLDESRLEIPQELMTILEDYPDEKSKFVKLKEGKQKALSDWIYSAKTDDKKIERIVRALELIKLGKKLNER